MFSLFSRKKPDTDEEYEKLLADLDGKVRRNERLLSELKERERKSVADITFYCAAAYVLYLGYYILAVYLPGDKSGYSELTWIGLTFAAIVLPLVMWYFIRLVRWLHRRRQSSALSELETLRKSQKDTVEELKKRTKFDRTKNLIEKYGGSGSAPRSPLGPGMLGMQSPEFATPVRSSTGQQLSGIQPTPSGRKPPPPFGSPHRSDTPSNPSTPTSPQALPGSLMSPPPPQIQPRQQLDPSLRIAPPGVPASQQPSYETPKAWYDKLFDALIGPAEGPNSKYALICSKCFAHNGLALAEEFEDIQYYCLRCQHFNSRRKGRSSDPSSSSSAEEEPRGRSRSAGSHQSGPDRMTSIDGDSPVRRRDEREVPGEVDPLTGDGAFEDEGVENGEDGDEEEEEGSVVEMDLDETPGLSH